MNAGTLVTLDEVLVDAVVDDIPFVLAGNLEHGVVGGAIDFQFGHLLEDGRLLGHLDGTEG